MKAKSKYFIILISAAVIIFAAADFNAAQVNGLFRVTSFSDSTPRLIVGGSSVTITATGRNLDRITTAAVVLHNRVVPQITASLHPPIRSTRKITLTARREAIPGRSYQLKLMGRRTSVVLPLRLMRIIVIRPPTPQPKITVTGSLTYNDNSLLPGTKDTVFPALTLRKEGVNVIGASVKVNGTALPEVRDGYYAVSFVDASSRQVEAECQSPPASVDWTVFVYGKFEDSWRVTAPPYRGTHVLSPGGSLRLRWSGPSRAVDINIYNGSSRIYLKRNVTGGTHDIPNSMLPVSDSLRIMLEVFNVANPLYRGDYARDSDVDLNYRSFTYFRTQKPEAL